MSSSLIEYNTEMGSTKGNKPIGCNWRQENLGSRSYKKVNEDIINLDYILIFIQV